MIHAQAIIVPYGSIHRPMLQVLEHPLADVVALPDEEDLFTWHGNVRGEADSAFTDVPFHFRLTFPQDYPNNPPKVATPLSKSKFGPLAVQSSTV